MFIVKLCTGTRIVNYALHTIKSLIIFSVTLTIYIKISDNEKYSLANHKGPRDHPCGTPRHIGGVAINKSRSEAMINNLSSHLFIIIIISSVLENLGDCHTSTEVIYSSWCSGLKFSVLIRTLIPFSYFCSPYRLYTNPSLRKGISSLIKSADRDIFRLVLAFILVYRNLST